jgi:hypothetical protein
MIKSDMEWMEYRESDEKSVGRKLEKMWNEMIVGGG